jgi:hypothetical protein
MVGGGASAWLACGMSNGWPPGRGEVGCLTMSVEPWTAEEERGGSRRCGLHSNSARPASSSQHSGHLLVLIWVAGILLSCSKQCVALTMVRLRQVLTYANTCENDRCHLKAILLRAVWQR